MRGCLFGDEYPQSMVHQDIDGSALLTLKQQKLRNTNRILSRVCVAHVSHISVQDVHIRHALNTFAWTGESKSQDRRAQAGTVYLARSSSNTRTHELTVFFCICVQKCRKWAYKMARHRYFEPAIISAIVVNVVVMMMYFDRCVSCDLREKIEIAVLIQSNCYLTRSFVHA